MPFITPVLGIRMHWKIRPRQLASVPSSHWTRAGNRRVRILRKELPQLDVQQHDGFQHGRSSRCGTSSCSGVRWSSSSSRRFSSTRSFGSVGAATRTRSQHVHGNTTLEIAWTIAPAVILVFIAIPTVRTIFSTQARAVPNALQVEVVGHQWWWEFRYPQYTTQLPGGTRRYARHRERSLSADRTNRRTSRCARRTSSTRSGFRSSAASAISSRTTRTICGSRLTRRSARASSTAAATSIAARRTRTCASVRSSSRDGVRRMGVSISCLAGGIRGSHRRRRPLRHQTRRVAAQQRRRTARCTDSRARNAGCRRCPAASGLHVPDGVAARTTRRPTHRRPRASRFPDNLTGDAQRGAEQFSRSACIGCHTVRGTIATVAHRAEPHAHRHALDDRGRYLP